MTDMELLGALLMVALFGYACTYLSDNQVIAAVKIIVTLGLVATIIGVAIIAFPIFVVIIVVSVIIGAACSRK